MENVLELLKGGLIVSCQATESSPFYGSPDIIGRMAKAAELGGAVGIRACGKQNLEAVKTVTKLPVVGINKILSSSTNRLTEVYITPTLNSALEICDTGIEILGLDCTPRNRTYEDIAKLIFQIKERFPRILIMADISTLEEGIQAAKNGADIVSTTLAGYTPYSTQQEGPDLELVEQLARAIDKPINAEGRYWTPEEVLAAFDKGAWCVTVGSAITRPELITEKFTKAIRQYWESKQTL